MWHLLVRICINWPIRSFKIFLNLPWHGCICPVSIHTTQWVYRQLPVCIVVIFLPWRKPLSQCLECRWWAQRSVKEPMLIKTNINIVLMERCITTGLEDNKTQTYSNRVSKKTRLKLFSILDLLHDEKMKICIKFPSLRPANLFSTILLTMIAN